MTINHQDTFLQQMMALSGAVARIRLLYGAKLGKEKVNLLRIIRIAENTIKELRDWPQADKDTLNRLFEKNRKKPKEALCHDSSS